MQHFLICQYVLLHPQATLQPLKSVECIFGIIPFSGLTFVFVDCAFITYSQTSLVSISVFSLDLFYCTHLTLYPSVIPSLVPDSISQLTLSDLCLPFSGHFLVTVLFHNIVLFQFMLHMPLRPAANSVFIEGWR